MNFDKDYLFVGLIIIGIGMITFFSVFAMTKAVEVKSQDNGIGMIAMIKGSIYGSGESMSVFGSCMDTNGKVVAGARAYFSAYYPNGSIWFENDEMTSNNNEFVWIGIMGNVGGTYLTKVDCEKDGRIASAYGEWQNPNWVKQIADNLVEQNNTQALITNMNGTILAINTSIIQATDQIIQQQGIDTANIQANIIMVNQTVVDQHNITRTYVGDQFNYTNQLIQYATQAANGSVDRNDSLLYRMLYYLMLQVGYPVSGNVTWDIYETTPTYPIYKENWLVKVKVFDEYNRTVSSPQVACTITSNLFPQRYMDVVGDHFELIVFMDVIVTNVTIDTNCARIV
jgi:hypothetical protein